MGFEPKIQIFLAKLIDSDFEEKGSYADGKIVGLIGSPRKLGNSELMVKEISRNIPVKLSIGESHKDGFETVHGVLSVSP